MCVCVVTILIVRSARNGWETYPRGVENDRFQLRNFSSPGKVFITKTCLHARNGFLYVYHEGRCVDGWQWCLGWRLDACVIHTHVRIVRMCSDVSVCEKETRCRPDPLHLTSPSGALADRIGGISQTGGRQ